MHAKHIALQINRFSYLLFSELLQFENRFVVQIDSTDLTCTNLTQIDGFRKTVNLYHWN